MKRIYLLLLLLLFSITAFANDHLEEFVNAVLEDTSLSLNERLDAIEDFFNKDENRSFLLEQSQYYHDISKVFYKQKNIPLAIESLLKAVKIRRNFKGEQPELLKKSLYNLGLFYRKNKETYKSMEVYKELLSNPNEDRYVAKVYLDLGIIYTEIGDFDKALYHFDKAKRLFEGSSSARNLFLTHLQISYTYTQMDRLGNSDRILNHLRICDSINSSNNHGIMRENESLVVNLRKGNLFLEQGRYMESKKSLSDALLVSSKYKDSTGLSYIHSSLGKLHIDQGDFKLANESLQNAERYAHNPISRALVANIKGEYYKQNNNWKQAEIEYFNAIYSLIGKKEFGFPTIDQFEILPNKLEALYHLKDLSNFYLERSKKGEVAGDLEHALTGFILADQLLDIIRTESTEHVSKLFWREQGSEVYLKGVEVSYLLNLPEQGYHFMEKSKAVLLLEDLSEQQAKSASGISDSIQLREANFKKEIIEAEMALMKLYDKEEKNAVKNQLFTAKQEFQNYKKEIALQFPNYAKIKKEIVILPASEIDHKLLDDRSAVFEFMLDTQDGYGYFRTSSKTLFIKFKNVQNIQNQLVVLREMLAEPFYNELDFQRFNELSHRLYQELFGDVEPYLEGIEHLIIIPDGTLLFFPFEVLQPTLTVHQTSPNYLLHRWHISYGLSMSHLVQNNEIERTPKFGFLGVAPIVFQNKELSNLKESETEVDEINTLFEGTVLKLKAANKSNVLQSMDQYGVLHISTHANFDRKNRTWLWFEDEKLEFSELYIAQNQADLVVLSACKTLQGELVKGEGIMSLSRGFLKTGANSVVASLWNSNDKSSREIIVSFYKYLKAGMPKDQALSESKKDYLASHFGVENSPYYWASNTITGNRVSLQITDNNHQKHFFLSLWVLLGTSFLLYIYFK